MRSKKGEMLERRSVPACEAQKRVLNLLMILRISRHLSLRYRASL